jgi:DNA polymerase I
LITTVHSLVLKDLDTGRVVSCCDQPGYTPIRAGLDILGQAERAYGHNIIDYDIPVLRALYPDFTFKARPMDTLVIVRMLYAHIKQQDFNRAKQGKFPTHLCGRHSLEAWGHRLGVHKGEYTEWCAANGIEDAWAEWRPEMQTYCEQDLEVNEAVINLIRKAAPSPESVETELELAEYLSQQERNGWPLDMGRVVSLTATLAAEREAAAQSLIDEFGWWHASNGQTTPAKTVQYKQPRKLIVQGAPYTKLKQVEFNPGSRDHIAKVLKERYGWQPDRYTDGGKPQVDEDSLKGLKCAAVDKVRKYLVLDKRLSQISEGKEAWLRHVTDTEPHGGVLTGCVHVHGRVNQGGTYTHRGSHSKPNIAQVPKVTSEYGTDCRACWTVPPGWVLIGSDASGLELRCLAHYMARYDGGAYARLLLEGDVHAANRDALGLSGKEGRDTAKTWIYAFLYGAGDELLGAIMDPEAPAERQKLLGKKLKKRFLQNTPAMKQLVDAVQAKAKENGYVSILDGRKTHIMHQHAALNSLLQSVGAIICKRWIVEFNRRLCAEFGTPPGGGWNHQWAALGWIHDEVQIAVRPEHADRVCAILVDSIQHMTDHFGFRLPLTGEAKVGRTWADTH